ncbi:VC0807 family protein [Streptomyces sp. NPDC004111]|uniref:VC0807 family protein n=1 Tax=Streptomyces sp. NPDC004111 TaxID=3364690 RepID=UPI0036B9830C
MSSSKHDTIAGLKPLALDAALPLGLYYALSAAGLSTFAALALSSVVPLVRTVWSALAERQLNALATLILVANAVGFGLSAVTGDPRLMLAKDSGITGALGLVVLVTALCGRPLMTSTVLPVLLRGDTERTAAWRRLTAAPGPMRRHEARFSLIWGAGLLFESVLRVVGAYTVPVHVMVGLGGAIAAVVLSATFVVSGRAAVLPMKKLLGAETDRAAAERVLPAKELTTAA